MPRVWVKRGSQGTPASIRVDSHDLIDDVKDAVFRKYPIALGRAYDSPDVAIVLFQKNFQSNTLEQRVLSVDTPISQILDTYFPHGQSVEEALVVQVPVSHQRNSPYNPPRVPTGSPMSGTLNLMSQNLQDFEYFPPTPPAVGNAGLSASSANHPGREQDYLTSNRAFAGAAYNSHTQPQTTQQIQMQLEGSLRAPPSLSLPATQRRYNGSTSGQRPTMNPRTATQQSLGGSTNNSYTRAADGSYVMYPKSSSRHSRASSLSTQHHYSSHSSPRNGAIHDIEEIDQSIPNNASNQDTGIDDRTDPSSFLPSAQSPNSQMPGSSSPPPDESAEDSTGGHRARRHSNSAGQRPALHRAQTQTKLNIVLSAESRDTSPDSKHGSSHSVMKLERVNKSAKDIGIVNGSPFGLEGLLAGVVPPINVLVVEDNNINQKILETFMKKRKIRVTTANNGREAVETWRKGGIHLVLMDIQMPIMSGLEATKEIRRLERRNNIGVFSKAKDDHPNTEPGQEDPDILAGLQFKSPVIIVALTASSLDSDRHEALAAGCNDFLTKPVSLVWLEKKVLEWGCMQALIDFEGWRKFRKQGAEEAAASSTKEAKKKAQEEMLKAFKKRPSATKNTKT